MVLINTYTMDWNFEKIPALRLCAMSSTVFTPKFFALLDEIQQLQTEQHLSECAAETKIRCRKYIHQLFSDPSLEDSNPKSLRLAAKLYALCDDVLVTASIQEKIQIWKSAYLTARQQFLKEAPYKIDITDIPSSPHKQREEIPSQEYCHEIINELLDYSDELEAWLDLYFSNEFDSYSDSPLFDDVVQIISDLRAMANEFSPE